MDVEEVDVLEVAVLDEDEVVDPARGGGDVRPVLVALAYHELHEALLRLVAVLQSLELDREDLIAKNGN